MMNRKLVFAGVAAMLFGGGALAADTAALMEAGNRAMEAQQLSVTEQGLRLAVAESADDAATSKANARLAGYLMSENRNGEAIEAYQQAIVASQEDAGLFVGIGIACLHESSYASANAMATRALALNPELEGAKKLALYIDKKQEQLAAAEAAASSSPVGVGGSGGMGGHAMPAGHSLAKW